MSDWIPTKDTSPIARKEHTCYLCGLTIAKGTKYLSRNGIGECGRETFRFHFECTELTKNWDIVEWESHDEIDFREHYKLGEFHENYIVCSCHNLVFSSGNVFLSIL